MYCLYYYLCYNLFVRYLNQWGEEMTEKEKRAKVVKHNAKRMGYFYKMLISIGLMFASIKLSDLDGLGFIFAFVLMLVCGMAAMCFKALHQGMLYCPLCGKTFGYVAWYMQTMPYRCPHCGEKLSY